MLFNELGLSAEILRAVGEQGYDTPTPIQAQAIPHVLAGRDLEGLAQTGTGKTAAFVLPILHRLINTPVNSAQSKIAPRVLVLVPTRELAAQVLESVKVYGKHTGLKSLAVFGGVSIVPQVGALRRGIDILVATPGRLLDHLGNRNVDLGKIQTLVLDEADRMFDMGFINDIRKIIAKCPKDRQTLLFSATFAPEVRDLAHAVLRNPALVEVARRNAPAEMVSQSVIRCDQDKKKDLLLHLFSQHGWHQTLIFCRTKHGADALAKKLEQSGVKTAALHGNKTQGARTRALADFKSGRLAALVATDIAARGIDIDSLPRVVNFELPHVPEDYIHRIGRTGRAGSSGEALSFVSLDERIQLRDIERLLKRELDSTVMPGFEPMQTRPTPKVATPVRRSAPSRSGSGKPGAGKSGAATPAGRNYGPRAGHSPRSGGGKAAGSSSYAGQRQR